MASKQNYSLYQKETEAPLIERFLTMVRDYVAQVAQAHVLLCEHLAVPHPMDWRSSFKPQAGRCGPNEEIAYFFHGFGCEVKTEGLWVDWDYDAGGRLGGVDTTRLEFFVERCTDRYPEWKDCALLHAIFRAAIEQGHLQQPYAKSFSNLYYLA